jgi:fatty acid desaturase
MTEDTRSPQINSAKIPISGNIIGAIVAVGSMAIFLIGLPVLWYTFPIAVGLGCGVAFVLHFARHKSPGAPWIAAATKK